MNSLKKAFTWSAFPSLLLLIIFMFIYSTFTGGLTVSFFNSFLTTNAGAICIAIGVSATILVAGTDISLGAIVSLVNVVIVILVGKGVPIPTAALIGLLTAVLCGMINGFIIGVMRVNPLLTTYATSIAFGGIALWMLPYPGGSTPLSFGRWYTGNMFGFIPTPLVLVSALIIIWIIFINMPSGIKLYALGRDVKKAYASGVNVTGMRFFVHTFAGLCAGVAGICLTANICAGSPTIGATMSMNSIAAAVIGGVSLNGGKGSIWGSIFGAAFLSILTSIVVAANLSSYIQSFVQGLILLAGVVFSILASSSDLRGKVTALIKKEVPKHE